MADLYIIHGWTYTVEPWKKTIELLREKGLSVKMLRVPGLTEESKKEFTIADYVKWAGSEIPDGAIALGHSNGGRILLNLCAEKPEKLKYLILLDAAGIYEPSLKKSISLKVSSKVPPYKIPDFTSKYFSAFATTGNIINATKTNTKNLSFFIYFPTLYFQVYYITLQKSMHFLDK